MQIIKKNKFQIMNELSEHILKKNYYFYIRRMAEINFFNGWPLSFLRLQSQHDFSFLDVLILFF